MSNQLDQRIRRLVVEVVDTSPPPPPFDELEPPAPQRRPARRLVVVAIAALTVIALAFGAAWFVRDERSVPQPAAPLRDGVVQLRLSSVPEGVKARVFEGTPVFVARTGKTVRTFLTDIQRFPGQRELWWCPDAKAFSSPNGEIFDRDGHLVGGPARYGLDQLATRVRGGLVEIDLRRIVPDRVPRQDGNLPVGACNRAVKAGTARSADPEYLDVETLPTLEYPSEEYIVAPPGRLLEVHFVSRGGTHTLAIKKGNRVVARFVASELGAIKRLRLAPGTYTLSCTISGHRVAGEQATLVVKPK